MTQAAILASNGALMTAPSGTTPVYQCRAWVNFNGTGTVAIRASGNVSSITDNGTGLYTLNFTTVLSDADYAFSISGNPSANAPTFFGSGSKTTSAFGIGFINIAGGGTLTYADSATICVSIFR